MIGPPSVNPNWLYSVSGFCRSFGRFARSTNALVARVSSLSPNQNPEPLYWFVPDFSVTLVTAPPARPNSAS